jgi:hypothetical protein
LLNSNNIFHGKEEVKKKIHIPDEDLEDIGTSSIGPSQAVAFEECYIAKDDDLPTNPASPPLHNQCHVQSGKN